MATKWQFAAQINVSVLCRNCAHKFVDFRPEYLTPGKASGHKTLPQYSSLTLLKKECYEDEVQPHRKTDYKPMIYIYIFL